MCWDRKSLFKNEAGWVGAVAMCASRQQVFIAGIAVTCTLFFADSLWGSVSGHAIRRFLQSPGTRAISLARPCRVGEGGCASNCECDYREGGRGQGDCGTAVGGIAQFGECGGEAGERIMRQNLGIALGLIVVSGVHCMRVEASSWESTA